LQETWRYIREDQVEEIKMLKMLTPLNRSMMDKDSAQSQQKYNKEVDRALEEATPWRKGSGREERLRRIRKSLKGKPGEVVVMLDKGEANDFPLYKGANLSRG
jgi:hypothetical protein